MARVHGIERLSEKLRAVTDEQGANAAVSLILKPKNRNLKVLLVKRGENSADPWSGQMAFPGGKRDPVDSNLEQTVIRETLEETGIDLLNRCRFLGVLDALRSTPRPELKILPFVILLERDQTVTLNNRELEASFWIPLQEITSNRGVAVINLMKVPAYTIGDIVIWGLTYRILESFFQATDEL